MKAFVAIMAVIVLAGCNADERGHAVKLDKGGYAGKADTALSDATREALRSRALWQSDGPAKVAASAGIAVMPTGEAAASGRIAGQKF